MEVTPELLRSVGVARFGPEWQKPLSEALNISPRTMRRWMNGEFEIPEGIFTELVQLVEEGLKLRERELKELQRLAAKMKAA